MHKILMTLACLTMSEMPAQAQQTPDYDPAILFNCLDNAETAVDRRSCIGRGSAACTETEAGEASIGLGYCYTSEWEEWDALLNNVYGRLIVQQEEVVEDNLVYSPEAPNAVEALRDMQRVWITYRDAACRWEILQYSGGTGGGPAAAECMMRLTAQQTLFLEEYSF